VEKGEPMKSFHFNKVVEKDGSIHLSGLPPHQEVEVVILERDGLAVEFQNWLDDIRTRHPLAKKSKEEVLAILRNTREEVSAERNAS
jgi:hypothetical protein